MPMMSEPSDARVEVGAKALAEQWDWDWEGLSDEGREPYRLDARAVLQAADAVSAVPGWMPIETAPKKGGAEVLLFSSRSGRPFIGEWGDYASFNYPRITHWMPLPAAPGSEQKESANG